MNLADADPSIIFGMFKGEPGTRKSTQALSLLPLGKQYWFSWDQKMQSLYLPAKHWGYNIRDIHYDDYHNWDAARARLEKFQINIEGYKTLIVDSITSMADCTLRQQRKGKSGKGEGKKLGTIEVDGIEEYNAESAALNELIALTKDIHKHHGTHIILIAHVIQAEYRNTVTNQTHISRTIVTAGKKPAAKIPAYCKEVYHFNIKKAFAENAEGQYSLLTTHTGDDFARTQYPLPQEIVFGTDPLYDKWLKPAIAELKVLQDSARKPLSLVEPPKGFIS